MYAFYPVPYMLAMTMKPLPYAFWLVLLVLVEVVQVVVQYDKGTLGIWLFGWFLTLASWFLTLGLAFKCLGVGNTTHVHHVNEKE